MAEVLSATQRHPSHAAAGFPSTKVLAYWYKSTNTVSAVLQRIAEAAQLAQHAAILRTAGIMLTYADICCRMLTYADVC
jgi:hypothetical protein